MSLDGISGWNYDGTLWLPPEQNKPKTNFNWTEAQQKINTAITQRDGLFQVKFNGEPTRVFSKLEQAQIFAKNFYETSLTKGSVFTQPTPTSVPAPTVTPISNPVPKQVPISGIYPTADRAEYARMLGNNPLPQQATATTPKAGLQPVRTWAKYAQEHGLAYQKPVKSGAVLADEIAAQKIAENQAKQATTGAVTKKPHVAPSAKPVSITTIDEITAATQRPIEPTSTAEARQKRVKTPEQRAAQLKNNPELASRYESYCKTVKRGSKLKVLKKAGKWGALAALVIGGGTLLYKACSNDKKDNTVKQEPETPKPSVPAKDKQTKPVETTTPAEPVESDEIGIGEFKDGKYKVKKGDNFWRIAEKNLIEEYKKAQKAKNEAIDENYKPTDAEILKETERLVGTNGYEFDEKHWNTTKPIYEGDILNIAA